MDEFYLDDKRRKFYDEALSHIRACENEFWDLDDNLDKYIDNINNNKNIRTMYSRRGKNKTGFGLESYLTICYTREVEDKVKNEVVPGLILSFENSRTCDFVPYYEPPHVQKNDDEVAPYLKYIEHPDYWNVFHVKLQLKGGYSEEHDKFWNLLSETLSRL